MNRLYDFRRRFTTCLPDLLGCYGYRPRQPCDDVPAGNLHGLRVRTARDSPDLYLDFFCQAFADEQAVISSHIARYGFTESVSSDTHGAQYHRGSEGDDRHVRRGRSYVRDQVADRLSDVNSSADSCSHSLSDDGDVASPRLECSLLDRSLFYLGDTARNTDAYIRLSESSSAESPLYEMLEKSLGNGIVRDDTRLERTNRDHVSGSALNKLAGFLTESKYLIGILVVRDDCRLINDNSFSFCIDHRIG